MEQYVLCYRRIGLLEIECPLQQALATGLSASQQIKTILINQKSTLVCLNDIVSRGLLFDDLPL